MAETTVREAPPAEPGETSGPSGAECPRCGAATGSHQLACLSCGTLLTGGGRGPGRAPRAWPVVAAVTLLVLLGGLALGYATSRVADDEEVTVADTAARERPAPAASTTPPAGDTQPPAGDEASQPEPTPTDPEPPADPGAPAEPEAPVSDAEGAPREWTAGTEAYTVVLLSTDDRSRARRRAREAAEQGLDAGVLRSDDYASLRPGFWVAFVGEFEGRRAADKAADEYAGQGFGGGYARFVSTEGSSP